MVTSSSSSDRLVTPVASDRFNPSQSEWIIFSFHWFQLKFFSLERDPGVPKRPIVAIVGSFHSGSDKRRIQIRGCNPIRPNPTQPRLDWSECQIWGSSSSYRFFFLSNAFHWRWREKISSWAEILDTCVGSTKLFYARSAKVSCWLLVTPLVKPWLSGQVVSWLDSRTGCLWFTSLLEQI